MKMLFLIYHGFEEYNGISGVWNYYTYLLSD